MAIHLELEQLYLEDHKERSSKTSTKSVGNGPF